MRPTPARQARSAHRARKAFARALHQILALRRPWMEAWRKGDQPGRIKVPYMLRHRRTALYRAFTS